jgi:hypothetical protein
MFISIKRSIISAVLALPFEFYAIYLVPRNINVIAARSLARQIGDYALNFLVFFIAFYLVLTLGAYLFKKIFPKSK